MARAKEHFPQARYEKMGLQEMDFHETLDGAICMDALEQVRAWIGDAGLVIEEQGTGNGYEHFVVRKR